MDESPGGISPPGAPKTVREPLDSHGSRCSTVVRRAAGFTSSTGSSCCQLASVGWWSRLNNAAPSVQLHYRAFVPTTSHSAPMLRIGTLVLAVLAACDFSLCIGAQVLTFRTKAWLSFAPPPCRMPLGPSQASPELIPKEWPPPVLASPNPLSTRHQRFACARLSQPCLTGSRPAVSATLTTIAFDNSSLRWLEIST